MKQGASMVVYCLIERKGGMQEKHLTLYKKGVIK